MPASISNSPPSLSWQALDLDSHLQALLPELIQLRRHIHRHPELSGHEQQTAALVSGELRRWGWRVREGVGRTGVVAELGPSSLASGAAAPLVALRVDMDALPVEERSGVPFASVHQGLMHACGHDIHTAVGLGVARVLAPASTSASAASTAATAGEAFLPPRLRWKPAPTTPVRPGSVAV